MNIPCDKKAICLDPADPLQNISSEAPDQNLFFGTSSGPGSYSGAPTGPGRGPRPGHFWLQSCDSADGPVTCAATSQAEADFCAVRLAQICVPPPGGGPPPDGGSPPTDPTGTRLFRSNPQACTAFCPDGSPFTFTVPFGLFVANSQLLADRQAHSYACRQASINKICLPEQQRSFHLHHRQRNPASHHDSDQHSDSGGHHRKLHHPGKLHIHAPGDRRQWCVCR